MGDVDYRALGRRGGLTTAMSRDMRPVAAHARKFAPSNIEYFYPIVDKDGTLDASDRDSRARAAQCRYYSDLARRRHKKNGDGNAEGAAPNNATPSLTDHQIAPDDLLG